LYEFSFGKLELLDHPREIDLGVAWEWQYDAEFVKGLAAAGHASSLSVQLIQPADLPVVLRDFNASKIRFRTFLDRASDNLKEFLPFGKAVANSGARLINNYAQMAWCIDKATMHMEFLANGLHVPYTIILSPYDHEPEIKITDLARLGRPFIIKPCLGSGGTGVVLGAETLADVLNARKTQNDQKFLLQEKIQPQMLADRRAWFRVYWVVGRTFIVWWNDLTHIYTELSSTDEEVYALSPMRTVIARIAEISKLDFFSAEIALTADNRFVVVDYVNDIVDMRLKSIHHDGVPDNLVHEMSGAIMDFVREYVARPAVVEFHQAALAS
jgi:hypothetical protein